MNTPDPTGLAVPDAQEPSGYRALYEASPLGMLTVELAGRTVVEANPAFCAMLGYRREELIGRPVTDLHPADQHAYIVSEFEQLVTRRAGVSRAVACLHKEGGVRYADIRAAMLRQDGIAVAVGFFSDVTALHELLAEREQMLAETETARRILLSVLEDEKRTQAENARLAAAIEQSAESVVIANPDGIIEYVNPAFERLSGFSRAEVHGQHTRILRSGQHDDAFYRAMWSSIEADRIWRGRMVNRRKNGELYTEDATISPVYDAAGKLVHYVAVKRDVTHEIEMERQLGQAQKMEVVGQLAGGIAHDFNNLLQTILGFTEMAMAEPDLAAVQGTLLPEIRRAGESAAALTRQLLAFSRRQILEKQATDLNELIERMGRMIRRVIGEDIDLAITMEGAAPRVLVDPGQIEQVLLNLVVNARDAMPKGGRLTICTRSRSFSAEDIQHVSDNGAQPGRYIQLSVADEGHGMDAATMARIFEPFFSTKGPGKGTGLGLATVFGIVQQHNGWIRVYSEPDQGTAFHVYLPVCEQEDGVVAPAPAAPVAPPPGRGEHILLVEDEPMIRQLMHRLLTRHGYRVTTAADAESAEALFDAESPPFDLVCSDVVLPGRSGFTLIESLKAKRPDIRVLMVSGYTDERTRWPEIRERGWHYLQKPMTAVALLTTLRTMLDDGNGPES